MITSPTGAVIRDILHRLAERFARPVLLWPVAVQGKGAAAQIAAAISGFNALSGSLRPDLLIVARGGGSLEDLWPYNEEAVVRATAASIIPLISAVGHETDTMLIDFAADRRAPTPSAAAEMAVPVRAELQVRVAEVTTGLKAALWRKFEQKREAVRCRHAFYRSRWVVWRTVCSAWTSATSGWICARGPSAAPIQPSDGAERGPADTASEDRAGAA